MLRGNSAVRTGSEQGPAAVLVVEDERIVAKDIARCLLGAGYQVSGVAVSAVEALHAASLHRPDLVLMDIQIQGSVDGVGAAQMLWDRFRVPVVYLTAFADSAMIARAKATSPLGYLTKPFKEQELHAVVEIALHKHELDTHLRDSEQSLVRALERVEDAVLAVDASSRITFMNPAAEALMGVAFEQVVGSPVSETLTLLHEHSRSPAENPLDVALRERRVVVLDPQVALRSHSGREVPIADSAAPILGEDGTIHGAVLTFRAVHEKRLLEQQLAHAQRLSSLGSMTAAVGHEISNPLTFVGGNIELALAEIERCREGVEEAASQVPGLAAIVGRLQKASVALQDAQEGALRVGTIVDDLRVLARSDRTSSQNVDVNKVLDWALRVVGRQIERRATLERQLAWVPRIAADETRLGQVFINVLVNATQAIAEGCPRANRIAVRSRPSSFGDVIVEIQDTGCGMPAEVQKRVFEPFFTTKLSGEGTGLGMPIARTIVKNVGGSIQIDSQPGVGTTVRLVFPAASPSEQEPTKEMTQSG